jgi:outer membrane protein assembly complex protein YaeT
MSSRANLGSRAAYVLLAVVVLVVSTAGCHEEGTIRITGIAFDGVEQVDEGRLKDVLATRESSWIPWGPRRYFDRTRFDADLQRSPPSTPIGASPMRACSASTSTLNDAKDAVDLTIRIREGDPVLVDTVRFDGFDVLPEGQRRRLEQAVPLTPGQPLDRQVFATGRETAVGALREHGYPYATVEAAREPAGDDPRRVAVVFRATPGPLARFGEVEIVGQASVGADVIRRELTFDPGDVFSRTRVRESQRRLYNLELFEFANVEPQLEEPPAETVPVRVTVAEGKHRRVNFGVGYGTEERGRVDARWQHANFLGGARTVGLNARWSSLDRGVRGDFTQPYFLTQHFSIGVSGQAWNAAEPAYSVSSFGGRATLTHRGDERNMWSVGFVHEYQSSAVSREALEDLTFRDELIALGLDPRDGTQEGTLVGFEFDVARNTTGNLLNARRGYYAALHLEQAGGPLPGTFNFYMGNAEVRYFLPLADRAVLATRAQIGTVDRIGAGELRPDGTVGPTIPFSRRFFLGGSSSLRGWGRFDVAPLSGAGLPIGGLSMLEMSTELRVPVWGNLSLVGFVDAGNVWTDPWQFDLGDLRYNVGPGLRYLTPIGPVRADIGYQVTPIEGLLIDGEPERRRWRVHFSIGQAF